MPLRLSTVPSQSLNRAFPLISMPCCEYSSNLPRALCLHTRYCISHTVRFRAMHCFPLCSFGTLLGRQGKFFYSPEQGPSAQAQFPRCPTPVSVALLQHSFHVLPDHVLQQQGSSLLGAYTRHGRGSQQTRWKMLRLDEGFVGHDDCLLQSVFQLAHISRPVVCHQYG